MKTFKTPLNILFYYLLIGFVCVITLIPFGTYYIEKQNSYKKHDEVLLNWGNFFAHFSPQTMCKLRQKSQTSRAFNTVEKSKFYQRYNIQYWEVGAKTLDYYYGTPLSFNLKLGLNDQMIHQEKWRVYTTLSKDRGFLLCIAEKYSFREFNLFKIIFDSLCVILFVYPLSGGLMWYLIKKRFDEIHLLTKTVVSRALSDMKSINLNHVPHKIASLFNIISQLYYTKSEAYEREHHFSSDVAHELYTPLSALKIQAQVAMNSVSIEEKMEFCEKIVKTVDHCTYVVDQLLILCRMSPEGPQKDNFKSMSLNSLIDYEIAKFDYEAQKKDIQILFTSNKDPVFLSLSEAAIHILLRNLIHNAIQYIPHKGIITIHLEEQEEHVLLQIMDNGPGVPTCFYHRLFDRFFRMPGNQNVKGSGLGLSIVAQIMDIHKGKVTLGKPEHHSGLIVNLLFNHDPEE